MKKADKRKVTQSKRKDTPITGPQLIVYCTQVIFTKTGRVDRINAAPTGIESKEK